MKRILTGISFVFFLTAAAITASNAATFRLAFKGDLKSLDPYAFNEVFTLGMLGNVYEGLTQRGPNLEIMPGLAESWETPEPTRWRVHLRRGVKFADGEDFTADDVLFSADRVRATGSDLKGAIPKDAKIVKIDDFTVDFVLSQPNPILNAEWDTWAIISRGWAEKNDAVTVQPPSSALGSFASMNTNGTGAFVVVEHQPGVRTVFKSNPAWWGRPVHNFTEVVFTTIANDATRVAALLGGDVDMIDPVPLQDIARIDASSVAAVKRGPEMRTIFLGFDQKRDELIDSDVKGKNPFKDVRVRRAVSLGIDEEAIATKIMEGNATPASTFVSPLVFKHAAVMERKQYDPAAAKALLADAGYPDGFRVGMDCPRDRYVNDEAICRAVTAMLARVGIRVDLNAQPKAAFFAKVLAPASMTSFYLLGWTPTSFDGANVLTNIFGCPDGKGRGGYNLGNYCNDEIDALTRSIVAEDDKPKRDGMLEKAFGILHDDAAAVPLHQQMLAWGVSREVVVDQRADNQIRFRMFSKRVTVGDGK